MRTLKSLMQNLIIYTSAGGAVLYLFSITIWRKKSYLAERYRLSRCANQYLKGKTDLTERPFMRIGKGAWQYQYFNVCLLTNMLSLILYVISNGFRPVIDLDKIEADDFDWEEFFLQPIESGLSAKEISELPLCSETDAELKPGFFILREDFQKKVWFQITKDFLKFNQRTRDYLDREYKTIMKDKQRVVGVICRGTDYIAIRPQGHPIQPEIEDLMAKVEDYINGDPLTEIYLATEEKKLFEQFDRKFPGRVLTNERSYYDELYKDELYGDVIGNCHFDRENDNYHKGIEYLSSLHLVSKCNALIAGNCGGTVGAILMNGGKYEYTYVFDLGVYE